MKRINDKKELFELMSQNTSVITPNNRLSASLLNQYFQQCTSPTVDKPFCLPYSTAIIQAYEQFKMQNATMNHPIMLNDAQCSFLWQKILKQETQITYSDGLLHAVIEAWETCQQWEIKNTDPLFDYTPQTRKFQQWWQLFDRQLEQKKLLTQHQITPYLLANKGSFLSGSVIWVCFDEFTPQQRSVQNHLENQGVQHYVYDLKTQSKKPAVFTAKDDDEEYQQLVAWLKLKIQEGKERVGVVIPDLQQKSRALQRIIQKHFEPNEFNISLGQSLYDFPFIAHALTWLTLDTKQLTLHQAALLLQSPYLGQAKEEFSSRSQYLQDSRLLQEKIFSYQTFIDDLKSTAPKLAALLQLVKSYPQEASPQEWVELIQQRLNLLGFPGDYGLNSENYQCYNRLTKLFDELRAFQLIDSRLTCKDALNLLVTLAKNTIFQAQTTSAVIHISGILEASGCEFDSLWVTNLTDQSLPQKTRLSAFIPHELQRKLHTPHSTPERELLFAQQTLQRLNNGSNETVFSYAQLQGDTPNLPCSLITDYQAHQEMLLQMNTESDLALIPMEESYSVALKSEEKISGGTALLANQAKCPFKAFADHRLRAKPALETLDGLDNKERGTLIHKVMELLWKTLDSQDKLLQLSPEALDEQIEKAIKTALFPLCQTHPDSFPEFVQEIECSRLKRVVLDCLDWEKQRSPFTIAGLEQSYSIRLANIDFKVRVDRLDQVEDKKWVIDYKSSLPASKPWNEDRPKEPQLLLYALLDEQINTLMLLQLKSGKIACSGISENKQEVGGISTLKKEETWELYRSNWEEQLTLLAEEFQQGHCPPQPASTALCQQCDFQNLCRFQINEQDA